MLDQPSSGHEYQGQEGKQWQGEEQVSKVEPGMLAQACQDDKAHKDLKDEPLRGCYWVVEQSSRHGYGREGYSEDEGQHAEQGKGPLVPLQTYRAKETQYHEHQEKP